MEDDRFCPLCKHQYDQYNPARILVACGHTLCENCLQNLPSYHEKSFNIICPVDGKRTSISTATRNRFPNRSGKNISKKSGSSPFKDHMSSLLNPELTISTGQPQSTLKTQQQFCPYHQKPLEVVCIEDLQRICATCAIFGTHRGHHFKSMEEIEQERLQYYNSILKIMDNKVMITERISNQETLLERKKKNMMKEINQIYYQIINSIKQKQKQSQQQLNQLMQKLEDNLQKSLQIQEDTLKSYNLWEDRSYQHLKVLEGEDFQAKLCILFTGQSKQILSQGNSIITQMANQQNKVFEQIQKSLESIGYNYNEQVTRQLNIISIFEKPKRKINLHIIRSNDRLKSPTNDEVELNPARKHRIPRVPPFLGKKISQASANQQSLLLGEDSFAQQKQNAKGKRKTVGIIPESKAERSASREISNKKQIHQLKGTCSLGKQRNRNWKSIQKSQRSVSRGSSKNNIKRIDKIKVPARYERVIEGLMGNSLQTVDFTNAELGQANIVLISQLLQGSKAKTVKFIRNKLEDSCIHRILPYMQNVVTLNISQNYLTEKTLDILFEERDHLKSMRNIVLSQNKIIQRKHKMKLERLRKLNLTISV